MKCSELLRKLKKGGCEYVRDAKGSHEYWYSPITDKIFIVPVHGSKEVATGTANKILKDAGLK